MLKKINKYIFLIICTITSLSLGVFFPVSLKALTITADYNGFTGTKKEVLEAAVKAWSDWFSCSDGQTINIKFIKDPNLGQGTYGYTTTYIDQDGNVPKAEIKINTNEIKDDSWTTGDPNQGYVDAMDVAMHEIGHGLGFINIQGSNFNKGVKKIDSNEFYDLNDDGKFSDKDFDLKDGDISHSEAWDNVMAANRHSGKRFYPKIDVAKVLSDAYEYCIVPEPTTWIIFATGLLGLVGMGRKKFFNKS